MNNDLGLDSLVVGVNIKKPTEDGRSLSICMDENGPIPELAFEVSQYFIRESERIYGECGYEVADDIDFSSEVPMRYNHNITVRKEGQEVLRLNLYLDPCCEEEMEKNMTMELEVITGIPELIDPTVHFLTEISPYINTVGFSDKIEDLFSRKGKIFDDDMLVMPESINILLINRNQQKIIAREYDALKSFKGKIGFLEDLPVSNMGYFA